MTPCFAKICAVILLLVNGFHPLISTFIAQFWVKFHTRNLSTYNTVRIFTFLENCRKENVASLMGVNKMSYFYARAVKPYDIFKGKNTLVNSMCNVTAYTILSFVPHLSSYSSVGRMTVKIIGSLHNHISVPGRTKWFLYSSESLHPP